MNRSFAQFSSAKATRRLSWLACGLALAACATLPPPTSELAAAQQAVSRANDADADQYADAAVALARSELSQAQAAMAKGRNEEARSAAMAASADAEFALATSNAARAGAEFAQDRNEILDLNSRLQLQADVPERSLLDIPPAAAAMLGGADAVAAQQARLQALEADPRLNGFAAYERLRAHQAIDVLAAARGKDREPASRIAERRVAIAEIAARTEATRRQIEQLQRQRSELLVEASRQEAEQARQEAERLRVQAQIQAEEAQRLREQADTEAAARQQAEDVIIDVGADEAAKLKAARAREAELAAQEAALLAGAKGDSSATKDDADATTGKSKSSTKPTKKKHK
jgi:hypothetical protein